MSLESDKVDDLDEQIQWVGQEITNVQKNGAGKMWADKKIQFLQRIQGTLIEYRGHVSSGMLLK